MKEEELNAVLDKFYNGWLTYPFKEIHNEIEKLREEMKKEHEDLILRATTAETKLKLYEGLFNRLNLNMELNNEIKK